jgi:GntR family transcriptional regulator/MocR family aminotransferase
MRASVLSDWLAQRLDRGNGQPIYRQLHRLLQQAILSRELPAGTKVPSSRLLAAELGVGRNTVTQVYEQLALEGYVSSATGRGTFVADSAPDEIVFDERPSRIEVAPAVLSTRGERLIAGAGVSKRQGGGLASLRHALADYLRTSRSVQCSPEQIVVTTGIHQSIDLAVRLLSDAGDMIWTEDPCYWGVRSVLQVSGLDLRAIRVDSEGIDPSPDDLANPPKLMLVTPSHQYPLGMVMSLARRRMLLEYARQHRCWIIEDDYDSEFRYGSRPLASLQGLDTAGQVIYVGSFGKTLFPGLRIGYIVVPEALAASFATASAELYREGQLLQQAVLAEFIAEGHFTSHIRRMRALYGQRRELMLATIAKRYGGKLDIVGGDAGLHLVLRLPDHVDDRAVAARALAENIVVRPLSGYFARRADAHSGLLIGYACVPDEEIEPAFETLAGVIDGFLG